MQNGPSKTRSILVCAIANTIHGLDRMNGQTRWTALPFGDSAFGKEVEIAIVDGVVIAVTDLNIAFIDYMTGHVHAAMGLPEGLDHRPTMVVDGPQVYIARGASLTCFSLRGQILWNRQLPCDDHSSMALGLPGNVRQADDVGER